MLARRLFFLIARREILFLRRNFYRTSLRAPVKNIFYRTFCSLAFFRTSFFNRPLRNVYRIFKKMFFFARRFFFLNRPSLNCVLHRFLNRTSHRASSATFDFILNLAFVDRPSRILFSLSFFCKKKRTSLRASSFKTQDKRQKDPPDLDLYSVQNRQKCAPSPPSRPGRPAVPGAPNAPKNVPKTLQKRSTN